MSKPNTTPLSTQNISKRDSYFVQDESKWDKGAWNDKIVASFQEFIVEENLRRETRISLAIKPKPSWLTEKVWQWLLNQLLVMKHFRE